MKTFWISTHFATFGITTENDIIINAAPIARWMIGKTFHQIRNWIAKNNATVEEL